jgi:hypothetical protein
VVNDGMAWLRETGTQACGKRVLRCVGNTLARTSSLLTLASSPHRLRVLVIAKPWPITRPLPSASFAASARQPQYGITGCCSDQIRALTTPSNSGRVRREGRLPTSARRRATGGVGPQVAAADGGRGDPDQCVGGQFDDGVRDLFDPDVTGTTGHVVIDQMIRWPTPWHRQARPTSPAGRPAIVRATVSALRASSMSVVATVVGVTFVPLTTRLVAV